MRDASASFTKRDYEAAVAGLMEYSRVDRGAAEVGPLIENTAEEWESPVVSGFLLYGHRDARGLRLVDRYVAARGRGLAPGEVAALVALQHARASLFEVEAVQLGSGLDLRDTLTGDQLHVHEVSGTAQLKKWDVLFAWLMTYEDHLELTGATLLVPRMHLEPVRAAVERELGRAHRQHRELPEAQAVGSVAWAPLLALRAALRTAPRPQIKTTDGEELVFCKAHYDVADVAVARARLLEHPDLDDDGDGSFTWIDRHGSIVLGSIRLEARGLVLETMSHERNRRGRKLIDELLASLATHRADTVEDVEAALRAHRERPPANHDDVPEEVQREVMGPYLRDYYRAWLDEPIPALGNKSPRKAVRSKRGKAEVEALLKDIENGTAGQPGGDMVDFAALRRELKLENVSADAGITYDADVAPEAAAWQRTDEGVRTHAVETYHRALAVHPATPDPSLHASMHVIIENQLAGGEPAAVAATLNRLVSAGLTRHEAIHAVASVVAPALLKVVREHVDFDRVGIERALERLTAAEWRFSR